MTVCVVAICDSTTVVGAADRMLTAGDVEFEPPQTKIINVTTSIAVLIAGDAALQLEVIYALKQRISKHVDATPNDWLKVRTVAEWYYEHFQDARNIRSENAILNPIGLTRDSFISRQNQLDSALANKLASELVNFSVADIQAIITGVDEDGPHIYVVENRGVENRDSVGFAAIGVGYWHANSQIMFAEHARWKPMPDTLFLTYAAKRRAEVAPGVGEGTDMFMIGPTLGSYFQVGDHVLAGLFGIYSRTRERAKESQEMSRTEVNTFVDELTTKTRSASGEQATPATATLPETIGTDDKAEEGQNGDEDKKVH